MALAYIDSCVVIYALEDDPRFGKAAKGALAELRQQGLQPVISALVRLECLVQPLALGHSERLHRCHGFLQLFESVRIQDSTFELATELRAQHRLRTPDALHLATALGHNCQALVTNDGRLKKASGSLEIRALAPSD
ncbi:PIN domain-containing protein [Cyanobium sp. WAJ14-Wanaka]|uniref:type II toxin-antitoxin system VapC family toxin n=1 Tax=Cyanobium sp. WAJ14-Wanaka TaxID=2823725 RepID=UPI0020CCCB39|nr:PIN domain-containing protein [Cyanobium sp. WAJ14-Wanaka]MCP9775063.1 PIN domain-containing protein [Cyanobium sp. WAJ14-Wanaka]